MTCLVCGSRNSEPHFGGISCSACAAFFRRFFNSKKLTIGCICKSKSLNSHPCRSCRVAKCLAIGMSPMRVHGAREANGARKKPQIIINCSPSTSSPSSLTSSLLSKDIFNLSSSLINYSEYDQKRVVMFVRPDVMNLFEASCLVKRDVELTFQFVNESFPEFRKLTGSDRRSLVHNLSIKLWNIEPVLDQVAGTGEFQKMEDEEIRKFLYPLYAGCFMKGAEMSEEKIWKTFGVFWKFYFQKLIEPICALDLDQTEFMALIWILFFDPAFTNISTTASDFCWTIRKVILKELRNYESEKYPEDPESRFLEILEIPAIVERGEQYFHEEILLAEMHKMKMDDEFKAIMTRQRI